MVQYPVKEKSREILKLLHSRRQEGEFCDVLIKLSETKSVHAHKALLAALSPYFESMFMGAFLEATSNEVDLSEMTDNCELLENIINSFYGYSFEVTEDNVADALNIATMFKLDDLREVCETVLSSVIKLKNAAYIFVMAVNYDMKNLIEKVLPTIQSRFHDYIVFKDDLLDLQTEHLSFLLSNIHLKFLAQKSSYLDLLLKWFVFCENDDRAQLLIDLIQNLSFEVTGAIYFDVAEKVDDIVEHLSDANTDVTPKVGEKLHLVLTALKPADYDAFLKKKNNPLAIKENTWDPFWRSDLKKKTAVARRGSPMETDQDIPAVPNTSNSKGKAPKKEKEKKSESESKGWFGKSKRKDEKDKDKEKDQEKNKQKEKEEKEFVPPIMKPRIRRVRTPEEQKEIELLTRGVIVIAPSLDLLEGQRKQSPLDKPDEGSDGSTIPTETSKEHLVDVCVYIPDRSIWYRLCTIDVKTMPREAQSSFNADMMMDMEEMMMHGGPEELEMMMMDMPRLMRRRMMERGPMGHMSMWMMREMEMNDELSPHASLMFREMMMRRHRFPPHMFTSKQNVQLLTEWGQKDKWKVVYLMEKLYFFNEDCCETAFCYDIVRQNWTTSHYNASSNRDPTEREPETLDGVEPVVIVDTLYAVVRIVIFRKERSSLWDNREKKDYINQDVEVLYKIFRMNEDDSWELVMKTKTYYTEMSIPKGPSMRDFHRHMMPMYMPMLKQQAHFKTGLYVEDEETLHIFLFNKNKYEYDPEEKYMLDNCQRVSLDLRESESIHPDYRARFLRKPLIVKAPEKSHHATFVGDGLKVKCGYELPTPQKSGMAQCIVQWGDLSDVKENEFLEASKKYPLCPDMVSADGHSIWILKGENNDVTGLQEMRIGLKVTEKHSPPPFRAFTLSTCAMLDSRFVDTLQVAARYMHS